MMAIDHSNVLWLVAGDLLRVSPDAYVSKTFVLTNFTYPASVAGVCADSQNNLYLSTWGGNQIYRLKTNGVLELFAGSGNYGSTDGNGIFTSFAYPAALAADTGDNIYVSDAQGRLIRRINQNRDVVTVAGRLSTSGVNDSDGVGTNATFYSIAGMSAAESGDLLLACGSSIRRMGATTSVTTLAGRFVQYNETGYQNGPGILALFNGANAVCIVSNSIFVADFSNQRIRQITFNPSPQPVLPANLQLATYPGLQITGTVGRTYQIQSSPDMNTWNTIATLLLTSSPYLWIDQNPARGSKFYRAWLLP
jgi:hypothetical protein